MRPRSCRPAYDALEGRRLLALMSSFVVTDTADDGSPGTLRAAINDANAALGPAVIDFAIPGPGVQTITLSSDLPAITNAVSIAGSSQGGPGYDGSPLIVLVANRSAVSPPDVGLDFAAGSDASAVQGLVLDGFSVAAIDIAANSVTVTGNEIGTDPSGTTGAGNANGVEITGAENTIGGTTAADRNIISANTNDGILISGSAATGNVIAGNDVGTDLTGTMPLSNLSSGVVITGAPGNTIGGTTPGAGNVISGNGTPEGQGAGVLINGTGAVGNLVQGNLIGTDFSGTRALANQGFGVAIVAASGNTVGGNTPDDGNVISGNAFSGVFLAGPGTTQNVVQGNGIGLATDGLHALGNAEDGIALQTGAMNNLIAANLIAANTQDGVNLSGATQNQFLDNLIGTNSSGAPGLGNGQDGVRDTGPGNNTIGGTSAGAGNTIADNGTNGVEVESGTGDGILGNAIFANAQKGIALGPGANNNQQFPDLTGVFSTGSSTVIEGTLDSTPSTTFRLEFFANDMADPSGFGQGQFFLSAATLMVTTAPDGMAHFSETVPSVLSAGQVLTATATDPANNTSEFSADAPVTALTLAITGMAVAEPSSGTTNLNFTVTLSAASPLTTTVNYQTIDGTAVAGIDYQATSGTLTFPPGATTESIPVPIIGHNTVGPSKSFSVLLSNPQNATITTAQGTGTILNNNTAGQFQFSMPAFVTAQDAGQATITVTRTGGAASAVSVNYATTAGGTAVPGVDFTPASGMLTFAANQASQTFTIPILSNLLLGENKTVALALSNPTDGGSLGPQDTAVLTILNPNSLIVTNTNDAGPGSLRQAILTADANLAPNTITFAIPGPGPYIIQPLSALPAITGPAVIDATTQPGFQSTAIVTLDGVFAGPQTDGLELTAGASAVRGLVIDRFSGSGIHILGPGGNTIDGDIIGTDAAGDPGLGNGFDGVQIDQSPDNTVGGTGNVIAANGLVGIQITGAAASGNVVLGNLIGTDPTGTRALGNLYDGVYIDGAPDNTIGGQSPGARNVISGNPSEGIQIDGPGASGNLVQGNDIGTDITGSHALGNGIDGIFLNGATGTLIGGPVPAARNIISGNSSVGIRISGVGTAGNVIQGNDIGTDSTGTAPLGNGYDGIFIAGAPSNTIGGTTPGAGNVISANGSVGIQLYGPGTSGNLIQGNDIGTDSTGTAALGNGLDGIFINAAANNTIGGPAVGARNLVSANGSSGIQLLNPGSSGNLVQGNAIGVDIHGLPRLGNAYGIFINSAARNTLGGPGPAANLVAGNTRANIFLATGSTSAVLNVVPIESGGLLTAVAISFRVGLNPAQAQNLSHYRLQRIGPAGAPLATVPLTSAVYNPVTQTVTLTLTHPVPAGTRLLLTVAGSSRGGPASGKFTTIIGSNSTPTATSIHGRRSPVATQHHAAIAARHVSLRRLGGSRHRSHPDGSR